MRALLADRYPYMLVIEMVGGGICLVGIVGLVASGLWYLNGLRVSHDQRTRGRRLAERVQRFLAGESGLAAVKNQLLDDGVEPSAVDAAVELEWPRGQKCAQCGAELRRFAFLTRHLRRSWYHCPGCSWVGQLAEDAPNRAQMTVERRQEQP
jgi:hypothetical protein